MPTRLANIGMDRTRWVSITSIMTALTLVGNYIVVSIPSVELGTTVLFVTAYVFGYMMALWVTLIMSIIYGTINPWGGFIPQIWLSQVIGWLYVVAAGAIAGNGEDKRTAFGSKELGIIGIAVTIFFDVVTTIGYSITFAVPFILGLIGLIPFMVVHVISNAILFATVAPRLQKTIREVFSSIIASKKDEVLLLEGEG
ncbi:MAG: hypothetical protein ACFFDR_11735 [Candidatus Thorarchaeota archaeon]